MRMNIYINFYLKKNEKITTCYKSKYYNVQ